MLSVTHSFGINFSDEEDVPVGSQAAASDSSDDQDDELLKLCMMAEQDAAPLPSTSRANPMQRAQAAPPSRHPPGPSAMVMEEAFPSKTKATDQGTLRELQQLFAEAQKVPAASSFSSAAATQPFRPTTNFADTPVNAGSLPTGEDCLRKFYGFVPSAATENAVPQPAAAAASKAGCYRDKWSGFRLNSVLTSPLLLDTYMQHRRPLRVASLEGQIKSGSVPYDFVLFGIVVSGGLTKLTAKKEKYITWRVSDLKSGSVTVCIFKKAYEKHKIIGEGTVVAILNPSIWKSDAKCPAVSCSYDTQILAVGICPDLGVCKGLTRTGECCGVNINLEHGSVCEFHLQQQLHSIRLKRAELNNRSVAGASSNRLFVPGGGAVAERPTGYNKPGPKVPMQVTYTPKMNAPTPGRVALTSNSTVSLENYEYFAGFAPPPPVTATWKPTMASSPVIRKIQERISSNASEPTASVLHKSKDSDSASKAVPKTVQSAAKTTLRPASRPPPVHLSSPVAQPVFCSSELEDDCLIVLEDPADALAPSVGIKRARAPQEASSNTSKKDSAVASAKSSDASTIVLKQPSTSQRPEAVAALSKPAPVSIKTVQSSVAVAKDSKAHAPQLRPESGKSMSSQPISSSAAKHHQLQPSASKHHQLQPSAVAALQAKIQESSKTDLYASKPAAGWYLPGGGAIQAPAKDNSQLLKTAQNFGVDVEAVQSQHSAHEDIADLSIKEREQRHTDMLFEAAKLEERQMGVKESKVSVWKCSKCSHIGYKYCPLHEDKAFNKRVEAIQRYFSCSHCKARITWLRNTLCTVACKCGNTQWKQCSQFKGKVASSEDVWKKVNTPSEFSLYHQL
jgi:hypothetical protein